MHLWAVYPKALYDESHSHMQQRDVFHLGQYRPDLSPVFLFLLFLEIHICTSLFIISRRTYISRSRAATARLRRLWSRLQAPIFFATLLVLPYLLLHVLQRERSLEASSSPFPISLLLTSAFLCDPQRGKRSPKGGDKMLLNYIRNWIDAHSQMIVDLVAKMLVIL